MVTFGRGSSQVLEVKADETTELALGEPIQIDFKYVRQPGRVLMAPQLVSYVGRAGEVYDQWTPFGGSPQFDPSVDTCTENGFDCDVSGMVAIGLGKLIWGGLGQNLFNPALVGRAFLLATFPTAMTTWTAAGAPGEFFRVYASNLAAPFMHAEYDAISAATPLGLMKFEQQETALSQLLVGNVAGCIGETSGLLLLAGGLYLMWRQVIDWRIPASILLAVVLASTLLLLVDADRYPGPLFSVFAGSLLIGAFFMATDPVSSPVTPRGAWIFGAGVGLLVVLIRVFGGFPEGVMYAILLMNAATPLIDRYTQPRVFGRGDRST